MAPSEAPTLQSTVRYSFIPSPKRAALRTLYLFIYGFPFNTTMLKPSNQHHKIKKKKKERKKTKKTRTEEKPVIRRMVNRIDSFCNPIQNIRLYIIFNSCENRFGCRWSLTVVFTCRSTPHRSNNKLADSSFECLLPFSN